MQKNIFLADYLQISNIFCNFASLFIANEYITTFLQHYKIATTDMTNSQIAINSQNTKLERQSNFEFLRILSMVGVLLNHTLQNLWNIHVPEITWENECRIFLMNWAILGVNCFIMISGYFSIKLSWRRIIRFYLQCFFYMAFFVAISAIINHSVTLYDISKIIFVCSKSGYFISCYFALMLLSPILNKISKSLTDNQMRFALLIMLIVDVYFGYMHQIKEIAAEGYELVHFITIYMIGSYIARTPVKHAQWGWYLFVFLLLMTVFHIIKMRFFPISIIYSLHYNSPCLIVAPILMFLWARTWHIQSKAVNWFAGGVFGVYLIQCNHYFEPYYWPIMKAVRDLGPWYVTPLLVTIASAAFFCIFVIFEKLRDAIFKPLENRIADIVSKKVHVESLDSI